MSTLSINHRDMPHVIFDFDGTIADSLPALIQTYHELAKKFKLNAYTDAELLAWRSKSAREILKLSGASVFKILPLIREGKELFGQNIGNVELIPGIDSVLRELAKNHHLGIVTSNSEDNVNSFLHRNNLDVFEFIYSDSTIFGKADIIKRALRQREIPSSQAVYVGDEIRDIHAARRSGVPCISVAWGLNSRDSLANHYPAKIIDSPEELIGALQALLRTSL